MVWAKRSQSDRLPSGSGISSGRSWWWRVQTSADNDGAAERGTADAPDCAATQRIGRATRLNTAKVERDRRTHAHPPDHTESAVAVQHQPSDRGLEGRAADEEAVCMSLAASKGRPDELREKLNYSSEDSQATTECSKAVN